MIPELGHYALVLALVMALAQASLPMVGAAWGIRPWMQLAKPAAIGAVRVRRLRVPGADAGVRDRRISRSRS